MSIFLWMVSVCLPLKAQTPPAALPPVTDATVVATSDGRKITAGEIKAILDSIPPSMRQNFARDPTAFLSQWFMLQKMVRIAEEQKLHERYPYKQGIAVARMQVLWQAAIEENSRSVQITPEELKSEYEKRKDSYTQANLKLIYIPFVSGQAATVAGAEKSLSEKEALAKAEELAKQARAGADFVQLVVQHSGDPISKEKNGDFGPIKRSDQLPEAVKQAIFALKPGEISNPVRQPNGFYIFKLIELTPQSFEEIRETLKTELTNDRVRQWVEANAKATQLQVERADYFESVRRQ